VTRNQSDVTSGITFVDVAKQLACIAADYHVTWLTVSILAVIGGNICLNTFINFICTVLAYGQI